MINPRLQLRLVGLLILTMVVSSRMVSEVQAARTLLKNICRVKGQEENSLRGLGLVVGLKGTGDGGDYLPTMRALARAMELMHTPIGASDGRGRGGLAELKNTKNVALVWVTVTVPATGARRGDKLDCTVSGISAKSLEGGRLTFAALQGPDLRDPRIYALAEGRVHLDDLTAPLDGVVDGGARMEENIMNAFQQDGVVTLVLDQYHADFQIATAVAAAINSQLGYSGGNDADNKHAEIATPLDPVNILVRIPNQYREVPVEFVAQVLDLPIYELQTDARVVINQRAQSIVISGDVEIGPVVVTHKNVTINTDDVETPIATFVPLDQDQTNAARLKSLVETLNAVRVPTSDIIEIIKGIDRNGKLHGKLVIE
jgi:flagellar P-ring protein FlgI